MFGSTSQAQPQQQTGGSSLFGNTLTTPKPAGSLFGGATATATSQPSIGSSLFGGTSTAATSQPQQTTATGTGGGGGGGGGLFGTAGTSTSQPQQTGAGIGTGTGLFGAAAQTQSQSPGPQSGGGLFGSLAKPAQQATTTGPSLFGQSTQQAQQTQQKPSLFLNQPAQPQTSQPTMGLGTSLGLGSLGQATNQQQTIPGVSIDVANIKGTTRFSDLQEGIQKSIEDIDKSILRQIRFQEELQSFMPGHGDMLENIPNDVKFVTRKYEGARNALESDAHAIEAARGLVKQDADHARLSFRAIDNLKLPQQYHTPNLWAPRQQSAGTANAETDGQDLVSFFSRTADEMDDQLKRYERNLTEIEMHLHGVQDGLVGQLQKAMATKNGGASAADEKIQELVAVLRDFEQGILKVAGEVGSAREGMTRLQLGEFVGNGGHGNGVY